MRPKITQKVAGLEFESHAWGKRKKPQMSLQPSQRSKRVNQLSLKITELWFSTLTAHCNHLGRLPGGFHPTDCELIGLGVAPR